MASRQEFTREEIFEELKRDNDFDFEMLDLDLEMYDTFWERHKSKSNSEVKAWCRQFKEKQPRDDLDIVEVLTVVSVAVKNAKFKPRDVQIVSILLGLRNQGSLMMQVRTGEGKSVIVIILAITLALVHGYRVDIVTSSPVLAEREAHEQSELVSLFEMGCSHISHEKMSEEERIEAYESQIVYGTVFDMECDLIEGRSDKSYDTIRGPRAHDVVIVDESDNLFIDNILVRTLLSSPVPGFHHANVLIGFVWRHVQGFIHSLGKPVNIDGRFYFCAPGAKSSILDWILQLLNGNETREELVGIICCRLLEDETRMTLCKYDLPGEAVNLMLAVQRIMEFDVDRLLQIVSEESVLGLSFGLYELDMSRRQGEVPQLTCRSVFRNGSQTSAASVSNDQDPINLQLFYNQQLQMWNWMRPFDPEKIEEELLASTEMEVHKLVHGSEDTPPVPLPQFVAEWFQSQVEPWVKNALQALRVIENEYNYIIEHDKVVIVDQENTGILQRKMKYGKGLHQFLAMKHDLAMEPLGVTSNTMTNSLFFRHYRLKVGITGTVGGQNEEDFLRGTFDFKTVRVPTFSRKQLHSLEDIVAMTPEEWIQNVVASVTTHAFNDQAVLVICESIQKARFVFEALLQFYDQRKVELYERDDSDVEIDSRKLGAGHIIVSTNLAGRGTDIRLTDRVNRNGGMHVVLAFLSRNTRVQEQAIGRTARQGRPGTAQVIINFQDVNDVYKDFCSRVGDFSMETIKTARDLLSKSRLDQLAECIAKQGRLEDYFIRFRQFIKSCDGRFDSFDSAFQSQLMFRFGSVYDHLETLNDNDDEKACEVFYSSFVDEMEQRLGGGGNIVFNGYDLVRGAYFGDKGNSRAISHLDAAIGSLGNFAAFAHYMKAYLICNSSEGDDCRKQVAEQLQYARAKFEYEEQLRDYFLSIVVVKEGTNTDSHAIQYTMKEKQLFQKLRETIDHALDVVQKSKNIGANWEKIEGNLMDANDLDTKRILEQFRGCGLVGYVVIHKKRSVKQMFLAFLAAVIGVFEIIGGCMLAALSCGVLANFGTSMIMAGIEDVFAGIKGIIDGEFDFGEWISKRALSHVISFVCAGLSWCAAKATQWINTQIQRFIPQGVLDKISEAIGKVRGVANNISDRLGSLSLNNMGSNLLQRAGVSNNIANRLADVAARQGMRQFLQHTDVGREFERTLNGVLPVTDFLNHGLDKVNGALDRIGGFNLPLDDMLGQLCFEKLKIFGDDSDMAHSVYRANCSQFRESLQKARPVSGAQNTEAERRVTRRTAGQLVDDTDFGTDVRQAISGIIREDTRLLSDLENEIQTTTQATQTAMSKLIGQGKFAEIVNRHSSSLIGAVGNNVQKHMMGQIEKGLSGERVDVKDAGSAFWSDVKSDGLSMRNALRRDLLKECSDQIMDRVGKDIKHGKFGDLIPRFKLGHERADQYLAEGARYARGFSAGKIHEFIQREIIPDCQRHVDTVQNVLEQNLGVEKMMQSLSRSSHLAEDAKENVETMAIEDICKLLNRREFGQSIKLFSASKLEDLRHVRQGINVVPQQLVGDAMKAVVGRDFIHTHLTEDLRAQEMTNLTTKAFANFVRTGCAERGVSLDQFKKDLATQQLVLRDVGDRWETFLQGISAKCIHDTQQHLAKIVHELPGVDEADEKEFAPFVNSNPFRRAGEIAAMQLRKHRGGEMLNVAVEAMKNSGDGVNGFEEWLETQITDLVGSELFSFLFDQNGDAYKWSWAVYHISTKPEHSDLDIKEFLRVRCHNCLVVNWNERGQEFLQGICDVLSTSADFRNFLQASSMNTAGLQSLLKTNSKIRADVDNLARLMRDHYASSMVESVTLSQTIDEFLSILRTNGGIVIPISMLRECAKTVVEVIRRDVEVAISRVLSGLLKGVIEKKMKRVKQHLKVDEIRDAFKNASKRVSEDMRRRSV